MLSYDGRVDGDSVGGYAVNGVLTFLDLDLRTLLDTAVTPVTALSGSATLNVSGDSLFNLVGSADLELGRSRIDSLTVHDGARMQLRFADGRMTVFGADTVETVAGRVVASGGLGLGASVRDSMTLAFRIDSLGGLRHYLRAARSDSLNGTIAGTLVLRGSVDSVDVDGVVLGAGHCLSGSSRDRASADAGPDQRVGHHGRHDRPPFRHAQPLRCPVLTY